MNDKTTKQTLRDLYPLLPKKITKKTLSDFFRYVTMLASGVLIFFIYFDFPPLAAFFILAPLLAIFFLLASLLLYLYEREYYSRYFYDLIEDRLIIRKGVFFVNEISIPLKKIQDIYKDQDILDRLFGLYDLHFSTATEISGKMSHIDGLSNESADAIRTLILQKIFGYSAHPHKIDETAIQPKEKPPELFLPSKNAFLGLLVSYMPFLIIAIIFPPLLPLLIWLIWKEFLSLRYELREDGVFIKRGFLTPRETLVIYKSIQDVEEVQTLIDKLLNIKHLRVKTMSTLSVSGAHLFGLEPSNAVSMRLKILSLAKDHALTSTDIPYGETSVASTERPTDIASGATSVKFPYHFLKSAIYTIAIYGILALLLLPIVYAVAKFFFPPFANIVLLIGLAAIALGAATLIINAMYLTFSCDYEITNNSIIIKYGLLNTAKKQIAYERIQDVEITVSFPQSIAGLATIRLETGSKELAMGDGEQVYSASVNTEAIPDIDYAHAKKLRTLLAERMGISLEMEGTLRNNFPLAKLKPIKKTLQSMMIPAVICGFLSFTSVLAPKFLIVFFGCVLLGAMLFVLTLLYEFEYFRRYYYEDNGDVLIIKKGVFGSQELIIPYSKIQSVYIDRDFLDVAFGLWDMYISTVTSRSNLYAHIDGLNEQNAEALAMHILSRIRAIRATKEKTKTN
ncbi:MAG: PH domain-containing protein [Candidatus Micrarchaeia archaeon]